MGVDADAILFWGILIDPDETDGEALSDRADDIEKEDRNRELPQPEDRSDIRSPEWEAWRTKFWQWRERQGHFGTYCDYDDPKHYVSLREAEREVALGEAKEIRDLAVDPTWEPRLRDYCRRLGVDWTEPKWWLVSRYST
jgi:hypothetical protein